MKRILSIFFVILITTSIIFQCSIQSSAVVGVDDAILIGCICFDLASMGLTIYGVSEFVKSDNFKDFCNTMGNGLENFVECQKRAGKLFFVTAAAAWNTMTNWVKSKFLGKSGRVSVEYETTGSPSSITLSDGTSVPYADWMQYPFFIYRVSGNIRAIYCTGSNAGITMANTLIQVFCTGHGTIARYDFNNGSWVSSWTRNMTYGVTYKGVTGSMYNLDFGSGSGVNASQPSFYLYRTIPHTNQSGTDLENSTPQVTPEISTNKTLDVNIDDDKIPGSISAPVERITDVQKIIIQVPQQLVDNTELDNPKLTTDINIIAQYLSTVTTSDVKPRVLTQPLDLPEVKENVDEDIKEVVDDIVFDTDIPVIEDQLNPSSDLDTANKFRLPKSFLEGFPFSIPYSVFVGIRSLIATPQAPYFSLPFSIPRLGINEDVVIDLNNWSPLARLSRAFLSVLWVAALAMTASKFIKH